MCNKLVLYSFYVFVSVINMLLGTKLGFGGSVDAASLLEFVDSGHDLILAADTSASELIREIAVECGVDFDEVKVLFVLVLYHTLHVTTVS